MPALPVTVRVADLPDVPGLVALGVRTFVDTYAAANDPADVEAQVAATYSEELVGAALRDPSVTYLVVDDDGGRLAGFAKVVVPSHEEGIEADRPAEISQLYVDSGQKGRGIGRALVDAGAAHARGLGCDYLWLGVWERNPPAIAFYERIGLRQVGTHHFQFGSDLQTDLLMGMSLMVSDSR
ncbi:GNAT family N-acetyltransferase [Myceligenerans crystallogenes]|uniref:GNAT family N-acetyltransferase n=1 Tax=Myceligenerans crystallogenes TaxID=316335 RepID=UPI0031CFB60F